MNEGILMISLSVSHGLVQLLSRRCYVLECLQGLVYFEPVAEPLRTDIADLVPLETEIFVKHKKRRFIYHHRDGGTTRTGF